MSNRQRIVFVLVACIVLALVGAFINYVREQTRRKRLTAEVAATIENVDVQRAFNPDLGKEYTAGVIVTFGFELNGNQYKRKTWIAVDEAVQFQPWGAAKVCYDPQNISSIENPRLVPSAYLCGENSR